MSGVCHNWIKQYLWRWGGWWCWENEATRNQLEHIYRATSNAWQAFIISLFNRNSDLISVTKNELVRKDGTLFQMRDIEGRSKNNPIVINLVFRECWLGWWKERSMANWWKIATIFIRRTIICYFPPSCIGYVVCSSIAFATECQPMRPSSVAPC